MAAENRTLTEAKRHQREQAVKEEQDLDSKCVRYFPYTGQETVLKHRWGLNKQRRADEKELMAQTESKLSGRRSPTPDQLTLPEFESRPTHDPKIKPLGKQDDKLTENATKLALQRYERDLLVRKKQRETDLKNFKDKIANDTLQIRNERQVQLAKQRINNQDIER